MILPSNTEYDVRLLLVHTAFNYHVNDAISLAPHPKLAEHTPLVAVKIGTVAVNRF